MEILVLPQQHSTEGPAVAPAPPPHDTVSVPPGTSGGTGCSEHNRPNLYLYQNINRVVLWIDMPGFWQIARDCHDHEEECANKQYPLVQGQADIRPAHIRELKEAYQPHESLSANYLRNRLIQAIKRQVMPKLNPDDRCQPVELITHTDNHVLTEPNTLVIYVQEIGGLQPFSRDKEHRAIVLRTVAYRTGMEENILIKDFLRENLTAIDLSWPDSIVDSLVSENIDSLLRNELPY